LNLLATATACVDDPVPVGSRHRLAFRLDDIQCWWKEANAQSIINAFIRHNVPLTVGIVTGPTDAYDCYVSWLKPLYDNHTCLMELSSHSVSHVNMLPMPYEQQLYEVQYSKEKIERLFNTSIKLFFPPMNWWNNNTVAAVVAAGYTTFSPQCTFGQATGAPNGDMCTTNAYPNIRPSFFSPIEGLIHVPVGCAVTKMDATGGPLSPDTVVNGGSDQCVGEQGICSIKSQIEGMVGVTDPSIGPFAIVMMHPADFPDDDNFIQNYFDDLLGRLVTVYDIRTMSALPRNS